MGGLFCERKSRRYRARRHPYRLLDITNQSQSRAHRGNAAEPARWASRTVNRDWYPSVDRAAASKAHARRLDKPRDRVYATAAGTCVRLHFFA